mmetsp:Transcript_2345/g.3141  ORF Transcript_2345/g.3141 Transcript_2345/m.3141 type:complete len:89 (+) Transcript_2345:84-350(+)
MLSFYQHLQKNNSFCVTEDAAFLCSRHLMYRIEILKQTFDQEASTRNKSVAAQTERGLNTLKMFYQMMNNIHSMFQECQSMLFEKTPT